MSTVRSQRLSLLGFNFESLYTRHLGRHSQFGLNVNHLVALGLIWFGVYGAIDQGARHLGLAPSWPVVAALALGYLATVALNAPPAVTAALAICLAAFVAVVVALPTLPAWAILGLLALVPIGYKVQSYGHRVWTKAADMSEFNRQIPPGRDLNLILLFHEVPICLNYLLFRARDWRR